VSFQIGSQVIQRARVSQKHPDFLIVQKPCPDSLKIAVTQLQDILHDQIARESRKSAFPVHIGPYSEENISHTDPVSGFAPKVHHFSENSVFLSDVLPDHERRARRTAGMPLDNAFSLAAYSPDRNFRGFP
jgi:hypothetical protein